MNRFFNLFKNEIDLRFKTLEHKIEELELKNELLKDKVNHLNKLQYIHYQKIEYLKKRNDSGWKIY